MSVPEEIGRYRVLRRLGTGAFAVVWLAHDERLHADVAVKVMADNWSYRLDIRERFVAEARLLRRANSGGVVQVFDIGDLPDGRPYFVMEYADHGTLDDLLTAGELGVDEALRLTAEAARGAAALHDADIVHRDIKPSNILLKGRPGGHERVLIADLGLAKNLAQASGLTVIAGSSGYMAPEQAEPYDGIDARADVYSLGAVLHHLLTGTVPGPPGKVLPADELRPGLPAPVVAAVQRAMEPDRENRWESARAFTDELERLRTLPVPGAAGAAAAPVPGVSGSSGSSGVSGVSGVSGASPASAASGALPIPDVPGSSSASSATPALGGSPVSPASGASPVPDVSSASPVLGAPGDSPAPDFPGSPSASSVPGASPVPGAPGISPVPGAPDTSSVSRAPDGSPVPGFPGDSGVRSFSAEPAGYPEFLPYPGPDAAAEPPASTMSPAPAAPAAPGSSAGATPRTRRPRTRRTVLTVLTAVVVAAAAGTALTLWERKAPSTERVSDATGKLSLEVPHAWATQLADAGWSPRVLGLDSPHRPGLTVAGSVAGWSDLRTDDDGVFAGSAAPGTADSTALTSKVKQSKHPGCRDAGTATYADSRWHGTVHTWDSCGTGGRSLKEIALVPVSKGKPPVYVQIRCAETFGTDGTDRILRSVRTAA
ncbi:serine/threonine-protein kinase [Streptomyces sp. SID10853]|uniref:serine/threonine-protein kinase n=1 Tax=Streptomyces sp. SID10853 TaxID=2706028 RepID=UPI001940EDED|nr:serine/threonine-protein kinase [Streptomyces sp. SID10853]